MADFLFDTAFFIDLRRGNYDGATQFWKYIEDGTRTGAYSPVSAYELWVGRRFSREEEVFYEALFSLLEEAPITADSAKSAGALLREKPDRTEKLFRDALIAATARERNEPVVTRNVRDFEAAGAQVQTY